MSTDGGERKSFPFLRKGQGLSRYSSLKIPKYPRRKNNYSTTGNIGDPRDEMNDDDGNSAEIEDSSTTGAKDDGIGTTTTAATDSGRGSSENPVDISPPQQRDEQEENHRVHFGLVDATPPENGDSLEPSLLDQRIAWEAREQRDNRETITYEIMERMLEEARNLSALSFGLGNSTNDTPSRPESKESAAGVMTSPEIQNEANQRPEPSPSDRGVSPLPPMSRYGQVPSTNFHIPPAFNPTAFLRFPQPEAARFPPLLPPMARRPFSTFSENVRPDRPPSSSPSLLATEKELRDIMDALTRRADQLERSYALLKEQDEVLKKQAIAEWQCIEQERETLKIQKIKIEQDKNDLFTHRSKMDEEIKTKLEKCNKSQDELKALQTEYQLLKRKGEEQKKLHGEELSATQQRVIDLERKSLESDSQASSFRAQITRLKEECKRLKEESDSLKGRNNMLESTNERLRAENTQFRIRLVENQNKATPSETAAVSAIKKHPRPVLADQTRIGQQQTTKSVRFADEPMPFQRTKDFGAQAAGPSDIATQTSFVELHPDYEENWRPANNPILERTIGDGKKEIIYPNDTVQIKDKDGAETISYANGDVLRRLPDGTKIFHSATDQRTEICNPDGTLVVKNADGTSETYKFMPNGAEIVTHSNGTVVERHPDGLEIAHLYDKSKETRCSHYTLREFPSGDMKKLYADGSTETRLLCGRVRIKDAQGNVIKDTDEYPMKPSS